jgi:hypothetical protein
MPQTLSVRPPDLQDFEEAEIVRLSPRSAATRRRAMLAGAGLAAAIVAAALSTAGQPVADLPRWWWPFIAAGWFCLALLLGATMWTVAASREPWRCRHCGAKLRKREATDRHPRLGDLEATIFVCARCRKFEAHLGTPPTSWS